MSEKHLFVFTGALLFASIINNLFNDLELYNLYTLFFVAIAIYFFYRKEES